MILNQCIWLSGVLVCNSIWTLQLLSLPNPVKGWNTSSLFQILGWQKGAEEGLLNFLPLAAQKDKIFIIQNVNWAICTYSVQQVLLRAEVKLLISPILV